VHVPCEHLEILDRRLRKHAVAEVEDVSGTSRGASQDVVCHAKQLLLRAEKQCRIEVPLYPAIGADGGPRVIEILTPINPDDITSGFGEICEDRLRADAEVNERHTPIAQSIEDSLRMR
jgi:hypothetical protein